MIAIVFVAALWPFQAPRNRVSWLGDRAGLRFERYSTAISPKPFKAMKSSAGCTLELWLGSARSGKGTILAFAGSNGSRVPFTLRQVGDNLALVRYEVDTKGEVIRPWLRVDHVFKAPDAFVTITSGAKGTNVYVNGSLAKSVRNYGLKREDFSGQLILGTSTINDSWTGEIRGLAIYPTELTADAVRAQVESWRTAGTSPGSPSADALYRFEERAGNLASNDRDAKLGLIIPANYTVLNNPFLQSPLVHYHDRWSAAYHWPYWADAAVNIAGFVPVGFCFLGYASSVKKWRHPVTLVIFSGFLLSLTVEMLQALLPTRNSGLTDVITNTLGTGLGAWLFCQPQLQRVWVGLVAARGARATIEEFAA
jgi:hypothetical protein